MNQNENSTQCFECASCRSLCQPYMFFIAFVTGHGRCESMVWRRRATRTKCLIMLIWKRPMDSEARRRHNDDNWTSDLPPFLSSEWRLGTNASSWDLTCAFPTPKQVQLFLTWKAFHFDANTIEFVYVTWLPMTTSACKTGDAILITKQTRLSELSFDDEIFPGIWINGSNDIRQRLGTSSLITNYKQN